MKRHYCIAFLLAFLSLSLLPHCSSDKHSASLKLQIEGLAADDTLLSIRFEGDTSSMTLSYPMQSPRFKEHIKLEYPRYKKAQLFYANQAYSLPIELLGGEAVQIKIDMDKALTPRIKGIGFNATMADFIRYANDELTLYQQALHGGDAAKIEESLRKVQERCYKYCLANSSAPGIASLAELYLMDVKFWRGHLQADWNIAGNVDDLRKSLIAIQAGSKAPDFRVRCSHGTPYLLSWQLSGDVVMAFTARADSAGAAYVRSLVDSLKLPASLFLHLVLEPRDSGAYQVGLKRKYPWTLVTDSASEVSRVMDLYHIESVPAFVHVDSAGFIVRSDK